MSKIKQNKNSGITLIALIITIIVMLILVAVTITMAIGGGLFNYAGKATKDTTIAKDKDLIAAAMGSWNIEKYTGTKTLLEVLQEEFGEENVTPISDGARVIMPSGNTYVVKDDGTIAKKKIINTDIDEKISDYVNYDCVTGVNSTLLSYESPSTLNGHSNQTISVDTTKDGNNKSIIKWRILGKDENDQILIISADPIAYTTTENGETTTTWYSFTLKGNIGYLNAPEELNKICGLYGHGTYADTNKYTYSYNGTDVTTGGKSVVVEDVNRIQPYTPAAPVSHTYTKNANDGYIYYDGNIGTGYIKSFSYYNEAANAWTVLGSGMSVVLLGARYDYTIGTSDNKQIMMRYYDDTTTDSSYWLASQTIDCTSYGRAYYSIRCVNTGKVTLKWLYYTDYSQAVLSCGIRPVITLGPDVILTNQDESGVWNLGIAE